MKGVGVWLKSFLQGERRCDARHPCPHLVVHYWNGGEPEGHPIRDISHKGLYVVTDYRWSPGTLIMISLQRTDLPASHPAGSVFVTTRVAHRDETGLGLEFIPAPRRPPSSTYQFGADRRTLDEFLDSAIGATAHGDRAAAKSAGSTESRQVPRTASVLPDSQAGQALMEYILVLPLLFLLIINIVNFAAFFYAWITIANAARAGADYAILGSITVDQNGEPSGTQISNIITSEVASLPNNPSLVVNACENNNGTITTLAGTCSGIASDPEAASFILTSIDVTYTYQPLIPAGFRFPNLNIYLTIPSSTVHRTAVMRLMR